MRLSALSNLVIHTGLRFFCVPTAYSSLCSLFSISSHCVLLFKKQKNLQIELSENSETHPQLGLVVQENETESYPVVAPLEVSSTKPVPKELRQRGGTAHTALCPEVSRVCGNCLPQTRGSR